MRKFILSAHVLVTAVMPLSAATADDMNQWLRPLREVIFISEWAITPEEVAYVKLEKLDNGMEKISASTSEAVRNGIQRSKKPDPMTERNLWKMSPWANQPKEMECIYYKNGFVVVSGREIYKDLKSQVSVPDVDVLSDRLFDGNGFTLIYAWRKAAIHLGGNPRLLSALLNQLTIEQTEIVIQLLVENVDFPLDSLTTQIDALVNNGKIEGNRLLKVLASSYWFASKKGEMDRAKELVGRFGEKEDGKDPQLTEALKILGFQKR